MATTPQDQTPAQGLSAIDNPYWREFNTLPNFGSKDYDPRAKDRLVAKYSHAIPDPKALEIIAQHSPIVEPGAGTGYWAYCLTQMGCDILAYDIHPITNDTNRYHRASDGAIEWHPVLISNPNSHQALQDPARALFLCWPPYATDMAASALAQYTGDTVIYLGEQRTGCTASDSFFNLLQLEWEQTFIYQLPRWRNNNDSLTLHRRKKVPCTP